jgi:hypothetical protein
MVRLGVHTRLADTNSDDEELKKIEDICLHNAKVCDLLGETAKMETWTLVSKLVQCRMKINGRGFDGWGGVEGGALGVGLMSGLLRFYESLGDVQMLSTLVCVLRNKRQSGKASNRSDWILLPPDQNSRYDLYIRRYAELLYGWRLLTQRAELIKHLTYTDVCSAVDRVEGLEVVGSGIDVDIECPRCTSNTHFGYCRSCNDFSFRCSICDNAVRGLFTFCDM